MLKLEKQKYILLPSADSINLISCEQGGENSPLSFNLPGLKSSQKCCPLRSSHLGFAGGQGEMPLGALCPSFRAPWPPALVIIIPLAPGGSCSCSALLSPSCPVTSSKHIDPESIYLVVCSICCSNIKCERQQRPWTTAEMLFRVWCYCNSLALSICNKCKMHCRGLQVLEI